MIHQYRAIPLDAGDPLRAWEGERKLVLAVLEVSTDDLIKLAGSKYWRARILFLEAKDWLESEEVYPFSFVFCCQVLGFDAEAVRAKLLSTVAERVGG